MASSDLDFNEVGMLVMLANHWSWRREERGPDRGAEEILGEEGAGW